MISFLETCNIFKHCYCIQLITSSSSIYVSFHPPPSSLNLFPFMDVTFSSFWTHSWTLFQSTLNFFASLWIEFSWAYLIVAFFKSMLYFWHLSPLWDIAWFSLMSFNISTNSNLMFAKMNLKFCFHFEKSIWIWMMFCNVDPKQSCNLNNSMQFNSFFFDNRKMLRACDNEYCEFRTMHQIKFQILIQDHHCIKMFGVHIRGKHW